MLHAVNPGSPETNPNQLPNAKTIAISDSSGGVMYTVPERRVCRCRIYNDGSTGYGYYINGTYFDYAYGGTGSSVVGDAALHEWYLTEGTVVKSYSNGTTYLMGVEYDA